MDFIRKYSKLIPHIVAIIMILTTIIFVSIAYAWFSNNDKADIDDATINVHLPVVVLASSDYTPLNEGDTLAQDRLSSEGFGIKIGFSPTNVLYPTTSPDGETFRYATNVDKTGQALETNDDSIAMFELVEDTYSRYFYLEQTFYILTTNQEDITLALSGVTISPGTVDSNLYKSIRIAIISDDTTILVKHDQGTALPANGDDTVVEVDPAIACSDLTTSDFEVMLPGMEYNELDSKYHCSPVKITLRLWIEGQSSFAVAEYSGHAFMAELDFDVINS